MKYEYIYKGMVIDAITYYGVNAPKFKVGDFVTNLRYFMGALFRVERIEINSETTELHLQKVISIEN